MRSRSLLLLLLQNSNFLFAFLQIILDMTGKGSDVQRQLECMIGF